jgi:protein-disulfide isomerase
MNTIRRFALGFLLIAYIGAIASAQNSADEKASARAKSLKAQSVTINIPEGMTKDQADAILNELRQIRQALEKQNPGAQAAAAQPPQKVNMSLGNGGYSLGREDAPLTMVEFVDYQCGFCRRFQADAFVELKKHYIDVGKVRFVSRDLPLELHQYSEKAAEAARCAGEQGKFWEMRGLLISTTSDLNQDAVLKDAQALLLDMNSFRTCIDADKYKTEIQKDLADAGSLQISGTPTFVLGKVSKNTLSGVVLVGAQPYSVYESAIQQALKEPSSLAKD